MPDTKYSHRFNQMTQTILAELTTNDYLSKALAAVFIDAMQYGDDDTIAASDLQKFIAVHLDDFSEMVADYVAERI